MQDKTEVSKWTNLSLVGLTSGSGPLPEPAESSKGSRLTEQGVTECRSFPLQLMC